MNTWLKGIFAIIVQLLFSADFVLLLKGQLTNQTLSLWPTVLLLVRSWVRD